MSQQLQWQRAMSDRCCLIESVESVSASGLSRFFWTRTLKGASSIPGKRGL